MSKKVVVEWECGPVEGHVEVRNGRLLGSSFFSFKETEKPRLVLEVEDENVLTGSSATVITILTKENPFSFFLHDVSKEFPIYIPAYRVIVTEAEDMRSFKEIEASIAKKKLLTKLEVINLKPEESYEKAIMYTRDLKCPTWLGISRDMRIFEAGFRGMGGMIQDYFKPRFHGYEVSFGEEDMPIRYEFFMGRGWGCSSNIFRRLEDGVLPILNAVISDEDIAYEYKSFVTLEKFVLSAENIRGTHFLVADGHGYGHKFTPEQEKLFGELLSEELSQPEETVLFCRVKAINTSSVPRYAFFKAPFPVGKSRISYHFDKNSGFGFLDSDKVFCVFKLNGEPFGQEEVSILLEPGESVNFEFCIPHRPISVERATDLRETRFDSKFEECVSFWKKKLDKAAKITLPEKRIEEMVKAGLLHLDINTYGLEPEGALVPTVGVYTAIGSESSPIVQFMDSMGWHDTAERALKFFIEKQHEDGFMQNFDNYMLEAGCVLWSIGEHYRYTHNDKWIESILPNIIKTCEFILNWRDRNKKEELRGKGYGLIEGQVGDPEDLERSFMLNGYAYLGLSRMGETLRKFNSEFSSRLTLEAETLKQDIRVALFEAIAKGPLVPLGDGSWVPTVSPWAGGCGLLLLFLDRDKCYTHGTFTVRDSLSSPLYLVLQEVIEPYEDMTSFMMNYHAELMTMRNVAFSQPYYSSHPFVHLKRDEVKAFLKSYYNTFASLADRETYTFWEHYFYASPHKTHEEGWFLMQTRWMLYMEEAETLKLLRGIPRAWLRGGSIISLEGVKSYFGPLFLCVEVTEGEDSISAEITCASNNLPKVVEIRLPHPKMRKPALVKGGCYRFETETVIITNFDGKAKVKLIF